jgi:hypothetical protein
MTNTELKAGETVDYDDTGTGRVQIVAIVDGAWVVARRTTWLWGFLPPFVEEIGQFRNKVESQIPESTTPPV